MSNGEPRYLVAGDRQYNEHRDKFLDALNDINLSMLGQQTMPSGLKPNTTPLWGGLSISTQFQCRSITYMSIIYTMLCNYK